MAMNIGSGNGWAKAALVVAVGALLLAGYSCYDADRRVDKLVTWAYQMQRWANHTQDDHLCDTCTVAESEQPNHVAPPPPPEPD